MKILYHHRVRSSDGQGVHITELTDALSELGHELTIVQPGGYSRASFGEESSTLTWIKRRLPKSIYELMELGYNVPAFLRLWRACGRATPEIVYERYSLYLLAGIWLRHWRRIPLILEVNAPLARERKAYGGIGLSKLAEFCEKTVWRHADHVLPVSQVLADEIRKAGVTSSRITVVPNAINARWLSGFDNNEANKRRFGLSGKTVIGFTGFMREWHRLDVILDFLASNQAPEDLHFLIVGDGPVRMSLERLARELGIQSRTTFTGLVDHDTVAELVGAVDIALQPAAVGYASPLKLFEYMALGKAIVAPDQPNIRETLTHDENALLFEPDNVGAMAEAIKTLARSAPLRDRLGQAARASIVERRMTWLENARRVSRIAAEVCRSPPYAKEIADLKENTTT